MTKSGFRADKDNGWILLCRALFYPITAALGRRKFVGQQELRIPSGVLVVANHISHLDPVYDAVYVRKAGRWPHFMAKSSLFSKPIAGTVLRGTHQIPVERAAGGAGQLSLAAATAALAAGQVVVIYPEGTITRDPGRWPMKPKAGAAVLALSGDFPVIPLVNWGAHEVFVPYVKKGQFKPLPRKDVRVIAGPPIDLSAYRSQPIDARAIRDVSLLIMSAVRDLLAEVRGEVPPTTFFVQRKTADGDNLGLSESADTDDPGSSSPEGTAEDGSGAPS